MPPTTLSSATIPQTRDKLSRRFKGALILAIFYYFVLAWLLILGFFIFAILALSLKKTGAQIAPVIFSVLFTVLIVTILPAIYFLRSKKYENNFSVMLELFCALPLFSLISGVFIFIVSS